MKHTKPTYLKKKKPTIFLQLNQPLRILVYLAITFTDIFYMNPFYVFMFSSSLLQSNRMFGLEQGVFSFTCLYIYQHHVEDLLLYHNPNVHNLVQKSHQVCFFINSDIQCHSSVTIVTVYLNVIFFLIKYFSFPVLGCPL